MALKRYAKKRVPEVAKKSEKNQKKSHVFTWWTAANGAGKARGVVGGDHNRDRDRDRTGQRRSLGVGNTLMPSSPLPMSFPSGKGPVRGRIRHIYIYINIYSIVHYTQIIR
jgi:hypothetical protein